MKVVIIFLFFATSVLGQAFYSEKELKSALYQNLLKPLTEDNIGAYKNIYWAASLFRINNTEIKNAVDSVLFRFDEVANRVRRDALEAVYALFPAGYDECIIKNLHYTASPKEFAMCAEYLLRNSDNYKPLIYTYLNTNFQDQKEHPILKRLQQRMTGIDKLSDLFFLFRSPFIANLPVIFSLQNVNRDYPGRIIIRLGSGQFLGAGGKLFSLPQLARSLSNLPGYLTNGNTPEGIFSFSSFARSENRFIGTTPNIQTRLPFEVSAAEFMHNSAFQNELTVEDYYSLLAPELRTSTNIAEAYLAGKAGRNEIIAHGTTVNSEYYADEPFYPFTPTHGCLCMNEKWETITNPLYSDQETLMVYLDRLKITKGLYVVVNVFDEDRAVSTEDLAKILENYRLDLYDVSE